MMLEGLDPTPLHVPYRVQYNIETGAKKALLLSLDIYHFFFKPHLICNQSHLLPQCRLFIFFKDFLLRFYYLDLII